MSVLIFIAVLFVLILVHEWGHYITAKKTGMRVDEFGIGFPPKLFGVKKGETEYTLNAFPIGGFVRIYGEDPAQVDDVDRTRAFGARPKWAQAIVLIAGVTMNVLLAWVLFVVIFMVGMPTAVDEVDATDAAELVIESVLPDSPAAEQLPVGVIVTAISDGEVTLTQPRISTFTEFVQARADMPLTITYRQGDTDTDVTLVPRTDILPDSPDTAALGVSLRLVDVYAYGFFPALWEATRTTVDVTNMITVGLATLIGQALVGTADFSQVAGPVGIVGLVDDAAETGIVALLTFVAFISLNLAVINLLPFPALDGGRLVFVAIEAITGRPINPVWTGRLNLLGFALLILLMVIITYNDILRLLN
jgi:regulator of sigma E protease